MILDKVKECSLLHRGGEADIYAIVAEGSEYVLKWYGKGTRYDSSTIQNLEHLNLPGLYRIRESGVRENVPYLVYDYIHGVNSADVLPMPVPVALGLLRLVSQTLNTLEKNGIHHGDLSPTNVILCLADKELRPVLIDCGIEGPGTLAFAAPERFQGKSASTQSDLFGLGMLLFRWIAGRDLLESGDFDLLASRSASVDQIDVTETLYGMGCCTAQELSALAPLWKSLLRADPENRAEDFEELDELLEIALTSIGIGAVSLSTALQNFASRILDEKSGLKFPGDFANGEKTAIPYRKRALQPKKSKQKFIVLGLFGFILVLITMWLVFGTKSPDIDATGNLLLEKSRSLDSVEMNEENGTLRGMP